MFEFQGDMLRGSLLTRYFGKLTPIRRETVIMDLRMPNQPSALMHGPGGNFYKFTILCIATFKYDNNLVSLLNIIIFPQN